VPPKFITEADLDGAGLVITSEHRNMASRISSKTFSAVIGLRPERKLTLVRERSGMGGRLTLAACQGTVTEHCFPYGSDLFGDCPALSGLCDARAKLGGRA
jgi:hypothetical protein